MFCVLMESLLAVSGHVFVCYWNRCGLWAIMFLCASGIGACEPSCIFVLVESWPVIGHVFV